MRQASGLVDSLGPNVGNRGLQANRGRLQGVFCEAAASEVWFEATDFPFGVGCSSRYSRSQKRDRGRFTSSNSRKALKHQDISQLLVLRVRDKAMRYSELILAGTVGSHLFQPVDARV